MTNISLKQLRAFLAVAETGSFTSAASQLSVTQSALSLLVKSLENEIGFRLLDRTTRRVTVSQAGSQFLPMARSVLDGLDTVIRNASEVASVQRGLVRVGGTEMVACTLLAPAIVAYQKHRPQVDVRLVDTTIHAMLSTLRNGDIEFLVAPFTVESTDIDGNISASPLFESPFTAYCSKAHPLGGKPTVGWNELSPYPLIVPTFDFSRWLIPRLQEHSEVLFENGFASFLEARQVTNIFTGLSLAGSGLGVMIAPTYLGSLARKFGLSGPTLIRPSLQRVIAVYTRRKHALSPGANDFLKFVQNFVGAEGYAST